MLKIAKDRLLQITSLNLDIVIRIRDLNIKRWLPNIIIDVGKLDIK